MTENSNHDLQDEAFRVARENPTTDHELLTYFDTGEFIYRPNAEVRSPEAFEAENWDKVSIWEKVRQWLSSFRG